MNDDIDVLLDQLLLVYGEKELVEEIAKRLALRTLRPEKVAQEPLPALPPREIAIPAVGLNDDELLQEAELFNFTVAGNVPRDTLYWGVRLHEGVTIYRKVRENEFAGLQFEVVPGYKGRPEGNVILPSGESARASCSYHADAWPTAWREELVHAERVYENTRALREAAEAQLRINGPEARDQRERELLARTGPWGPWAAEHRPPPIESLDDPPPPPGWTYGEGGTPAHARGWERRRALMRWIKDGGTAPWLL